jgi:hypothetical protein
MSVMYEITGLENNPTLTGSLLASANSFGASQNYYDQTKTNSISTGSWIGLANTWGTSTQVVTAISASGNPGDDLGLWSGAAHPNTTWGLAFPLTESIERFKTITDATPEIDQGVGPGEWDPFPIPEPPVEPELPQRDVTRFKKSYSSQRMQPKRIRLVRN